MESNSMVDVAQIVSAIATSIAALCALVTTIQNHKASKDMKLERHVMVKPIFKIRSVFEQRDDKKIDFTIKNIGFDKLNSIDVSWEGTPGVHVIIHEDSSHKDQDYVIRLDFVNSNFPTELIRGKINLFFIDILGKEYTESINIDIGKQHNEILESDLPILQNELVNKRFE